MTGGPMGWLIAFIVIAAFVATAVTGVLYPVLYGIFIAAIVIVPLWLAWTVGGGIINALFGRKK